ncbi:MAG: Omp28-related outer membrane protein, partial [Flavobacteriales bacterium]
MNPVNQGFQVKENAYNYQTIAYTMKKKVFFFAVLITVISCRKDTLDLSDGTLADIPPVPSTFGQNVIIEQFTQTTNGQCPLADSLIAYTTSLRPDRIAAVNIHVSDPYQTSELTDQSSGGNLLNDFFNTSGVIPAGMMNRNQVSAGDLSISNYTTRINSMLSQVPRCGIALDANEIANGYLNLSVHVGFSADLAGSYRLHVYLVQNSRTPSDSSVTQSNDFSQNGITPLPGTPYYDLPDPIYNYQFPCVLERVVSSTMDGEPIPTASAVKGKEFIKDFIIDLRGKNIDDYSIIAFVDKYGTTATGHRIENGRMVQVGAIAS